VGSEGHSSPIPATPTTWCAPQYRHRVINVKAAVAERLENAGAVLIAKLATNPFAGGGVQWYRGLTRSPWNPHLDAAGSSVGVRLGDRRRTRRFLDCGGYGRQHYPPVDAVRHGRAASNLRAREPARLHATVLVARYHRPICRSADDCGLVFAAIHGADPRDAVSVDRPYVWPSSRDMSTIRVGYSPENRKDEDREELRVLRELGVKLVPIRKTKLLDDYGLTFELIEAVVAMESAASFDELTRRGEPKGVHGWPRYWAAGHLLSAVDYLKISRLRAILMERLEKLMQTIDIYLGMSWPVHESRRASGSCIPQEVRERPRLPRASTQFMAGRAYDESTLLALATLINGRLASTNDRRLRNSWPRRTSSSGTKNSRTRISSTSTNREAVPSVRRRSGVRGDRRPGPRRLRGHYSSR
jgi:Asp-tRNAAsn/Glu-tRNAGln amidotransferase A subunit and related amidases